MNPFGSTRQSVGGLNQYEPKRSKRWAIVPFRPCRPPTPPWIIDWPLENKGNILGFMTQDMLCQTADSTILGDPKPGLTFPPEILPLRVNPSVASGPGTNPSPNRVWMARCRGFGAGNVTVAVSPNYKGPARITSLTFVGSLIRGGGLTPSDSWSLGVGSAVPVVDTPLANAKLSGYSIFDVNESSDQGVVEMVPASDDPATTNFPQIAQFATTTPLRIEIPANDFQLWLVLRTHGASASNIEIIATIETTLGVQQAQQLTGGVPTNLWGDYIFPKP